jgi:cytochrome c-type biogenesis protein CcmH/NrfF
MEIQVQPTLEDLKLTLWVAGVLIVVLVAIIAYFLKRQIEASTQLTKAVNDLTIVVNTLQVQATDNNPRIEKRLNEHSAKLKEMETRVVRLETEHKLIHCKKE